MAAQARARSARHKFKWMLNVALGGMIVLALSAPLMEVMRPEYAASWRQAGYAVIVLLALLGLRVWAHPRRVLAMPWPLVAALGWCWISLIWSAVPERALSRVALTTLVMWTAFATVRELGYRRSLATARTVLTALLIANYAAVFLIPEIAIERHAFSWSTQQWVGLFLNKNYAGAFAALTVLFFVFDVRDDRRALYYGIAVFAALFAFMSVSRTALIAGVLSALLGATLTVLRDPIQDLLTGENRRKVAMLGYAILVLALVLPVLLVLDGTWLHSLLSDPELLSRRTQVWAPLIGALQAHPLLGTGFGSFWVGNSGDDAAWLTTVDQGHNGYLDLLVQLGIIGFAITIIGTVAHPASVASRLAAFSAQSVSLPLSLFVFALLSNLTESGLLNRDVIWEVFFAISLAMIYSLKDFSSKLGDSPLSAAARWRSPDRSPRKRSKGIDSNRAHVARR